MSKTNLDRRSSEVIEKRNGTFGLGLGLTVMFHVIFQVPTFFLFMTFARGFEGPILAVANAGLTQLIYMIPAILLARHRGETETAKGLIVGASITFLLSATCNGFWIWN